MARESFGQIEKLPSKNYRARYVRPDNRKLQAAPLTFPTKRTARDWLTGIQAEISGDRWVAPEVRTARVKEQEQEELRKSITFGVYAKTWVAQRTIRGRQLAERTRAEYLRMLTPAGEKLGGRAKDGPLVVFVDTPLNAITADAVRLWYAEQIDCGNLTQAARSYDFMKSILKTAHEDDDLIKRNPCRIRGASTASTGIEVLPPTDKELDGLLDEINPRYKALVVIVAAGALRFGEVTELRADNITVIFTNEDEVDLVRVKIQSAVVKTRGKRIVKSPKSAAGIREITIHGADAVIVAEHVEGKTGDMLLFTDDVGTGHLAYSTFYRWWHKARVAVGRPDLHLHSLRHFAATRYSRAGATLAEVMKFAGHSTVSAAMRYQHAGDSARADELALAASRSPRLLLE